MPVQLFLQFEEKPVVRHRDQRTHELPVPAHDYTHVSSRNEAHCLRQMILEVSHADGQGSSRLRADGQGPPISELVEWHVLI